MKRLVALVTVLLALTPSAWAHGDTGRLELVESESVGPDEVRYVVRLTFANDGHPATGGDVQALVGEDEVVATMSSDGDGLYSATVAFPTAGEYAVTFRADEPAATLQHTERLIESTTTSTIDDASDVDNDAPNVAEEPLPDPDEGGSTWLLVLMAIIVAVMVVLAVAFVRGRRPPE